MIRRVSPANAWTETGSTQMYCPRWISPKGKNIRSIFCQLRLLTL